jgi:hypothetical protein
MRESWRHAVPTSRVSGRGRPLFRHGGGPAHLPSGPPPFPPPARSGAVPGPAGDPSLRPRGSKCDELPCHSPNRGGACSEPFWPRLRAALASIPVDPRPRSSPRQTRSGAVVIRAVGGFRGLTARLRDPSCIWEARQDGYLIHAWTFLLTRPRAVTCPTSHQRQRPAAEIGPSGGGPLNARDFPGQAPPNKKNFIKLRDARARGRCGGLGEDEGALVVSRVFAPLLLGRVTTVLVREVAVGASEREALVASGLTYRRRDGGPTHLQPPYPGLSRSSSPPPPRLRRPGFLQLGRFAPPHRPTYSGRPPAHGRFCAFACTRAERRNTRPTAALPRPVERFGPRRVPVSRQPAGGPPKGRGCGCVGALAARRAGRIVC